MSRRQLIAAVAAGGVLIAVLVVGTGLGWLSARPSGGSAPSNRLAVSTFLDPHPAFYGDVLKAGVDVKIDPKAVSASSVRVTPSFDPYVQTGPPVVTTSGSGKQKTLRYRYSIQCVSDACLPLEKPYALKLPPVTVNATAGTEELTEKATWPTTFVATRLQARDVATTHFRRPTSMPTPSFAVSPGGLANTLTVVAGLLAVGALVLIGLELVRLVERRRQRAQVALTPLEAALAYTRDAAQRPDPADRRKALELLATTLESEGVPRLADTASDIAWSEEPPTPDRALQLADEVEGATRAAR